MMHILQSNLLWTQASLLVLVLVFFIFFGFIFYRPLAYSSLLFFGFSIFFFRNPERVCIESKNDSSVIICPADGTIVDIQFNKESKYEEYYTQKVSIFLSVFDVHVNRAPIKGNIERIQYKPGEFALAFLPKSSELNERNDVIIANHDGKKILVRQIAGSIARTICCWANQGQDVKGGEPFGMIKFGSRVEVFLPEDATLAVGIGQNVYGGQSVLARW